MITFLSRDIYECMYLCIVQEDWALPPYVLLVRQVYPKMIFCNIPIGTSNLRPTQANWYCAIQLRQELTATANTSNSNTDAA